MAGRKKLLATTAEGLGTAMGAIAGRVDAWKKERHSIAADIHRVVLSAQQMLNDLGNQAHSTANVALSAFERKRRGGRPKGYKMSDETKAKLRAAWKRRKAGAASATPSRASKGKRTMSADAREKIAAAQRKRWAQRKSTT